MIIQKRPKIKFSGEGKLDFETHLKELESAFSVPGLAAETKLSELAEWFSGSAFLVVKRFSLRRDATTAYKEVIEELRTEFGRRRTTADEMLESLLAGEKLGVKDSQGLQSFVLKLENVYAMALETERAGEFDRKGLPIAILNKKVPHLADRWALKWSKNEVQKGKEYGFVEFLEFLKLYSRVALTMTRNKATDPPVLPLKIRLK